MLRTHRTTPDIDGFHEGFSGIIVPALMPQQDRLINHRRDRVGVLVAQDAPSHVQRPREERLGFLMTTVISVRAGEIVHGDERVWMLFSQSATPAVEGA